MASIEEIMSDFVPVADRAWYPWVWPDREWFVKTGRDKPKELQGFLDKVRGIALEDFYFFCDEIMRVPGDDLRPPLNQTLHGEVCHIMQKDDDVVILIPRGHLKTTIANVAYSIWRLIKNPNMRLLIASDTENVAKKFLSETKQNILTNSRVKTVFPSIRPAKINTNKQSCDKWSSQEIILQRNIISGVPSITAMGTNQTLTGTHYDHAIYDDLVNFDTIKTEEKIAKTKEWYLNSLPLLDPGARKVIIGTRYDDKDLYGFLEDRGGMPFYIRAAVENDKYYGQYRE